MPESVWTPWRSSSLQTIWAPLNFMVFMGWLGPAAPREGKKQPPLAAGRRGLFKKSDFEPLPSLRPYKAAKYLPYNREDDGNGLEISEAHAS